MARVLVTGGAGFTGQHLLPALLGHGYEISALARDDARGTVNHHSLEWIGCDLTNASAVDAIVAQVRPEYVVHLAALAFVGHDEPEAFYRVNLFGTLNLLEALGKLSRPPAKVLIASSANVYGANAAEVVDETVCPRPVNHYACSKLVMEHMVRTWFHRLPVIVSRPFNYTGRGQPAHFVVPKIVEHFQVHANEIRLGNIDVSRDFSDVRDVVRAYVRLLECDAHSDTVNICSGHPTPLRDVLRTLETLTGHRVEVKVDPDLVRTNEVAWLAGNNSRLHRLTGFRPEIPLHETLEWMFRNQAEV
jgi:GDP-6-deoxy-D-talose 4-dehydrogenase